MLSFCFIVRILNHQLTHVRNIGTAYAILVLLGVPAINSGGRVKGDSVPGVSLTLPLSP